MKKENEMIGALIGAKDIKKIKERMKNSKEKMMNEKIAEEKKP